jgi:D-glycero-D-manno-heptose 1,7-bisphosphate phosphatase
MNRAVFLDRDGVLIEDFQLLVKREAVWVLPGVPNALKRLKNAGFQLVVVSNQAVVARGMATEDDVRAINHYLEQKLVQQGAPLLDGWYFCPHHPYATLMEYRVICECRKPSPGLILQATKDHQIDLSKSFTVGDRLSDIAAGKKAGTTTVLVETGKHLDPLIESTDPVDSSVRPDYTCPDLASATDWILQKH